MRRPNPSYTPFANQPKETPPIWPQPHRTRQAPNLRETLTGENFRALYPLQRTRSLSRHTKWGSGGRRFKSDRPDQIYQGFPRDGYSGGSRLVPWWCLPRDSFLKGMRLDLPWLLHKGKIPKAILLGLLTTAIVTVVQVRSKP